MSKNDLDTRIANVLNDPGATPDQLNELLADIQKAFTKAEQVAQEARAKALNPNIADTDNSAMVAAENDYLQQRYRSAYEKIADKLRKTQLAAARAACNEDADKTQALRDEVEAEFNECYAEITELWARLVKRIEAMTREVARVNNSAMNDTRRVLPLDQVTKVMAAVKLPSLQNPQQSDDGADAR
jgi:hypothetical protein